MKYESWLFGKDGALMRAAAIGRIELVQELVARGANVNIASTNGFTPLHRAAQNGHKAVVEFLLNNGARADAGSNDDKTPSALAILNGHLDIAGLLSEHA